MRILSQRCLCFMLSLCLACVVFMAVEISHFQRNCSEKSIDRSNRLAGSHHLCLIVPFKDRFDELLIFAPEIKKFLDIQTVAHQIVVINQIDTYRFNRASLINIGFLECRRLGSDYMAMHDIDLLPLNPHLDYGYPSAGPYHVSAPEYHPNYHYQTFVGGVLLLSLADYEKINGMSNKYWGWGLEDDEFYTRMVDAKLTINRPKNLSTNTSNTFRHIHDRTVRKRDVKRVGEQKKESRKRDRTTGLKDLRFELVRRTSITIEDASVIIVSVKLFCDKSLTPWCKV